MFSQVPFDDTIVAIIRDHVGFRQPLLQGSTKHHPDDTHNTPSSSCFIQFTVLVPFHKINRLPVLLGPMLFSEQSNPVVNAFIQGLVESSAMDKSVDHWLDSIVADTVNDKFVDLVSFPRGNRTVNVRNGE
jgi:hypothetical protein